jgi:phage shock protein E
MRRLFLAVLIACAAAAPAPAVAQPANPQIDYAGFRRLAREVQPYRQARLVDWAAFARAAARPGVLILDARSESAFAAGHIAGAVNLPLTDFTADSLRRVIGRRDRPILIYCNNNFRNDAAPVMLKARPLALNIQTFINLVGYGYRNVRELNEVIDFNDPQVRWVRGGAALAAR